MVCLFKVLNSRWVSSSRDIVALRQTLNNPESCLAFRKFVALKGETYENDVLFWVEVQKYKVRVAFGCSFFLQRAL